MPGRDDWTDVDVSQFSFRRMETIHRDRFGVAPSGPRSASLLHRIVRQSPEALPGPGLASCFRRPISFGLRALSNVRRYPTATWKRPKITKSSNDYVAITENATKTLRNW